jgi:beta-N-acetylhexosaminidase
VIVVAVRDPYDIAYFDAAPTYLATYGSAAVSMESLAKVLYGEIKPTGKLPVDIPVAGQPLTPLYPFGHGLSW